MAAEQAPARQTATPGTDVVVFLIGMRINKLRSVRQWGPVFTAMPRMLSELRRNPDRGLLHAQTFVSGRSIMVVQYWRSVEDLQGYARSADDKHLPAWRAFNRRARGSSDVGIFHETFPVPADAQESVYVNLPALGLGKALGVVPAGRGGRQVQAA